MLVLSRKCHERIQIDGNIELTVLEIHGNRVKLGLNAPSEIPIQREKIRSAMAAEGDGRSECPQLITGLVPADSAQDRSSSIAST